MKCPYCGTPGFPRVTELYTDRACEEWVCVKCPNPVTYSVTDKRVTIWSTYNDCWYSIAYMEVNKQYVVHKEGFEIVINVDNRKEEYNYRGAVAIQVSSDKNITPENAKEKLALLLTFS